MLVSPVEDAVGALVNGVLLSQVVTHRVWWQRVPALVTNNPRHNSFGIKFRFFRCRWCHSVYAHCLIWFYGVWLPLLRTARGQPSIVFYSFFISFCNSSTWASASWRTAALSTLGWCSPISLSCNPSSSCLMTICADLRRMAGRYFLTSIIIFLVYVGRLHHPIAFAKP